MFNIINRVQNSFGYFTTVLSIFAAVVSLVSIIQLNVDGAFSVPTTVNDITPKGGLTYSSRIKASSSKPKELCKVTFDLEAGRLICS